MHAEMWHERLRDEPRFREAVERLWPYALGVVDAGAARRARRGGSGSPEVEAVERGTQPRARRAVGGDDDGAALRAGCEVVTAEAQVWAALDEVPDPEIPVISLVELGVVRDVAVTADDVHVEFTPTFLGCPALAYMRDRDGGEGRASSAPSRTSRWSPTTRGRPTGSPPAGREKLRAAGFAPPPPREAAAPTLSNCRRRRSAARTATRTRRAWTTSSARPRAARSATARAAGSRSSSSRRSSGATETQPSGCAREESVSSGGYDRRSGAQRCPRCSSNRQVSTSSGSRLGREGTSCG